MASVGRGNGARVFSGLVIALALAPAALAQSDPSAQTATLPASVTGVWTLSGEDRFGRFEGEVLFGDVGRDGRVTFSGTRVYADGTTRSLSGEGFVSGDRLTFDGTLAPVVGIAGRLGGAERAEPITVSGSYRLSGDRLQGSWSGGASQRGTDVLERSRTAAPQGALLADVDQRLRELEQQGSAFFSDFHAELYLNSLIEEGYHATLVRQQRVADRYAPRKKALVEEATKLEVRIDLALNSLELDPAQRSALALRRDAARGWASRVEDRWAGELAGAEGFARRRAGGGEWVVEKEDNPPLTAVDTGRWLSTGYNKVATNGLNELRKLDLDPILTKEVDRLVKDVLPDEVPADYRKAIASELTKAVADHPYTENITNALENFLGDVSDFLYSRATFRRVRAEADEEKAAADEGAASDAGTANDGGASTDGGSTGGASTDSAQEELDAAKADLEEKRKAVEESAWKLRNEFKVDVKPVMDWSVRMVKSLTLEEAVKLEHEGGFSTRAYVKAQLDKPLTGDASATVTTGVQVKNGGLDAHLRGTATVSSLYTDPTLSPTGEVALDVAYKRTGLSTTFNGKVNVPLGEPADGGATPPVTYDLKGAVTVQPTDALTLATTGHVSGTVGQPATWEVKPSLTWKFDEPWTLTLAGNLNGVGDAPPNYGIDLGAVYKPSDDLKLTLGVGVNGVVDQRPNYHGSLMFTYTFPNR